MKKHEMKLGLLAAAVITAISGNAMAQDTQNEQSKKAKEEAEQIEVIEVTGTRSALSKALLTKKHENTIGEGISVDDIGTLPSLDLADAMQVIPGVQVNRESNDDMWRSGEISLRGLPGSFTTSTANGQTFASPSGSVTPNQGVPSAFGAFASSIYDGVWVGKSQRADLVEGGIAGTVDRKLTGALSKKEGFVARLSLQHEELMDETAPTYFIGGSKHLIEDRLAVSFKYDRTEEEFRQDQIQMQKYKVLNNSKNVVKFPGLDDWKAEHNISAEDEVVIPTGVKQATKTRSGVRNSFAGNIEFQATDDFKVGANLLYTDRDLDFAGENIGVSNYLKDIRNFTPTSDPVHVYTDPEDGQKTYLLPGYDFENISINQNKGSGSFSQEAKGVVLYATYTPDDWVIDASFASSDATFVRWGANNRHDSVGIGGGLSDGSTGSVYTGLGNIDNFKVNYDGVDADLSLPYVIPPGNHYAQTAADYKNPTAANQKIYNTGNEVFRDRTDTGFNLDFERELYLGPIESVKFGARYNEQEVESYIYYYSVGGLSTAHLSNDMFEVATAEQNNDFFGGHAPGADTSGWLTLADNASSVWFLDGVDNPEGYATSPYSGHVYQLNKNSENQKGQDKYGFTTTKIKALYALVNLDTEVFGFEMRGNAGVRYVETDLEGSGYSNVNGVYEADTAKSSYDNFLPSVNLRFALTEDLYLRAAYSKAINRPNPAGFTPGSTITENEYDGDDPEGMNRVSINLPETELDPYTADNYDLSLEWYNSDSGLVSLALYRKELKGYYDKELYCPADGGGYGYGTMELVDVGGGQFDCITSEGWKATINQVVNLDDTITIDGMELSAQQDLSFLEGWVSHFGGRASLTLIDNGGENEAGDPLNVPSISDKSYNLVGYWDNGTVSGRLAYNWRSEYDKQVSSGYTSFTDKQVKARGQLDASIRYNVNSNLVLSLQAFNLTEELVEIYMADDPRMMNNINYDGRTYKASIAYKF